ncbi:MAG: FAD-dependent oxidoreductase [Oscillospiraceae bacterium]|jgi:2-enoate reductase|nr:FAD-dependent oxidoreductase [Oscillospiraceae bacterium]
MAKLFDPISFGGVTLKNRLAVAPMGTIHAADGGVSEEQRAYLVERAKGGFGLIYPSAHTITDEYEHPHSSGNFLCNESHAQRLKLLADEVHQYGAKLAIQLSPGYGRVNVGTPETTTHVSASEVPAFWHPDHKCKALSVEEIHTLVEKAGKAAKMAKDAGVDILEVHAYGGYMLDQFISSCWNHREDEYGGSLENRLRFIREFYEAIRAAVGPEYPVSVKFTPQHSFHGGRTLDNEGVEIVKILDTWGFSFIHLDHGCYEVWNKAIPSAYDEPGSQLFIARRMRQEGITTPFLVQGKLNYAPQAEAALMDGTADMIAMGHQSLADPYWPSKVQQGRLDDVVYCTACNECLNSAVRIPGSCAINPLSCKETKYRLEPTKNPRRLLVVGGGPGGMYTAALAAELGHDVTLWEKDGKLGGLINAAGAPDFKVDMRRYKEHLIAQLYKHGVKVEFMKTADEASIDAFKPDAVILATGAESVRPPINGIDGENVVTAYDLLANGVPVGERVVVLGGGHVGCEVAIDLEERGKKVTVVEMGGPLVEEADMSANMKLGLKERLNRAHIQIHTYAKMVDIAPREVVVETERGFIPLICDNVVLASGFRASGALAKALEDKPYPVFPIGDCVKPGKVYDAVHGGFHALRKLG